MPTNPTDDYERESIARAGEGDAEAGRECLSLIMHAIDAQRFDSPLLPYLAECIQQYLSGVRIDRAFNVEKENKGGRPAKYNPTEVAAVDILLRDHANFQPEQSIIWLIENIHPRIDRRFVQRVRKEHDRRYNPNAAGPLMESCTRDLLLHLSGSLRKYVGKPLSNC